MGGICSILWIYVGNAVALHLTRRVWLQSKPIQLPHLN